MKKAIILSLLLFMFPYVSSGQEINTRKNKPLFELKILDDFKSSFLERLEQNKEILIENSEEKGAKTNYFDIIDGRKRETSEVKKDILERGVINSIGYSLEETPIAKKMKNWLKEQGILNYFRMKFYKKIEGDVPVFIRPGQKDENNAELEYEVSLSASIYEDPGSIRDDFSIGIKCIFRTLKSEISYRPDTNCIRGSLQYKHFAILGENEGNGNIRTSFLIKKNLDLEKLLKSTKIIK